jgi:hypothetical protein
MSWSGGCVSSAEKLNARFYLLEASVRKITGEAWQASDEPLEGARMVASNALNVGARDAEVVQLAVVESIELANGLLISGPLLEGLADAHGSLLSFTGAEIGPFGLQEQVG